MPVKSWVKELVNNVNLGVGVVPLQVGKVYSHPIDGPIRITSGQYWGEYGISNFWYWTVIATRQRHYGYGGYWPEIVDDSN